MGIDLRNISRQDIKVKKEHPFKVCFELDEEVTDSLEMASSYTFKVKIWKDNKKDIKTLTPSVSANVITVEGELGLEYGEYYFIVQPETATLTNYVTIEGYITVE